VRASGAGLNGRASDGGSGGQAGHAGSGERCGVGRSSGWGARGCGGEGAGDAPGSVGTLGPGDE
jgi:hypothetical protein